jgi:hypothetical protein
VRNSYDPTITLSLVEDRKIEMKGGTHLKMQNPSFLSGMEAVNCSQSVVKFLGAALDSTDLPRRKCP